MPLVPLTSTGAWLVFMSWAQPLKTSSKDSMQQKVVLLNDSWMPQWASTPGQPRPASLFSHYFIKTAVFRWLLRHKMATCCFWQRLTFSPAMILIHSHLLGVLSHTVLRYYAERSVLRYFLRYLFSP